LYLYAILNLRPTIFNFVNAGSSEADSSGSEELTISGSGIEALDNKIKKKKRFYLNISDVLFFFKILQGLLLKNFLQS
jgi:hypothetical protein